MINCQVFVIDIRDLDGICHYECIYFEFALESKIVERIVNTLQLSYDLVYTYVIGLLALPLLANASSWLFQAET